MTSVPWNMGMSTALLAVLWAACSVASFEEIWDAVASSELYSQTPLPFWRAIVGCIAIGSLATAVDWFVSFTLHESIFTLHESITCSYNCVIEKGFSEEEKIDFPYLRRYLDAVLVPISPGTEVTNSNWVCSLLIFHSYCVDSTFTLISHYFK